MATILFAMESLMIWMVGHGCVGARYAAIENLGRCRTYVKKYRVNRGQELIDGN